MPNKSPVFIARRLCAFSLMCAFVSFSQQVESLIGACGIYGGSSPVIALIVRGYCLICAFVSFLAFINAKAVKGHPEVVSFLGFAFLALQFVSSEAVDDGVLWTTADRLLIELCILLHPRVHTYTAIKLFAFRYLFGSLCGQLLSCSDNWNDWQGLKFDLINQPFPLAPIWHINLLPPLVVAALSVLKVLTEIAVALAMLVTPIHCPFEVCGVIWGLVYTGCTLVLGNFNWSLTVFAASLIAALPPSVVDALFGLQMLRRWGCFEDKRVLRTKEEMERLATSVLIIGSAAFIAMVAFYVLVPLRGLTLSDLASDWLIRRSLGLLGISAVFAVFGSLLSLHSIPDKRLRIAFLVTLAIVSWDAWTKTIMYQGSLPMTWSPDYSDSLSCSTFTSASELHSRDGRSSYIFYARVDGAYPEDRYAEFVLPGGTLIEETRPGHLLFDFPRLSLALWRAAVPAYHSSKGTEKLLARLRSRLATGHGSIQGIFSDTSEYRMRKLLGNPKGIKEVMVYFQKFHLTKRFADHLWFTKKDKLGLVMDKSSAPKLDEQLQECPASLDKSPFDIVTKYVPFHAGVVTLALGSLIAKLVFL